MRMWVNNRMILSKRDDKNDKKEREMISDVSEDRWRMFRNVQTGQREEDQKRNRKKCRRTDQTSFKIAEKHGNVCAHLLKNCLLGNNVRGMIEEKRGKLRELRDIRWKSNRKWRNEWVCFRGNRTVGELTGEMERGWGKMRGKRWVIRRGEKKKKTTNVGLLKNVL